MAVQTMGTCTAIIYCRVSTKEQFEDGDSIENQERACREYCKRMGIKVVAVFHEAFTGKSSARPEYYKAVQFAIENKVNYFIIFDLDRFSREGYEVYKSMKDSLLKHNIVLKDSKNVIGDAQLVVHNERFNMEKYKWAKDNPTEMAEMVYSAQALIEGKKILQRTIPQAIQLAQRGFWVRGSIIGFENTRVKVDGKKRTILTPHPVESLWIIRMYELRAEGFLDDEVIVKEINALGYQSGKKGIQLTVKQMQAYIRKPVYAGFLVEEWTNFRPVKAQFPGLVSIETWNKANNGKYKLIVLGNNSYQLFDGKSMEVGQVKTRRKKYDPELPYRNLIKSSLLPGQFITGSRSRNKRGNLFAYYHPIRKRGRVGENVAKKEFENIVETFFQGIGLNKVLKQIFLERMELIFETRKSELLSQRRHLEEQLNTIQDETKKLQERACSLDPSYTMILQGINEQLQEKEKERRYLENQLHDQEISGFENSRDFQQFCLHLIEHLGDLLSISKNLEEKRIIFSFVFREIPTFQEIVNRTPQVYPIFALDAKKEPSMKEDSYVNPNWQGGSESNGDQGLWRSPY